MGLHSYATLSPVGTKKELTGSVSASSTPIQAKMSLESSQAVRSHVQLWAVSSHTPEETKGVESVGKLWNYRCNSSLQKHFLPDSREELSPGPRLVYVFGMPLTYPILEIKMNVLWSVPRSSLTKIVPERWSPAHLDILHGATLTLDLKTLNGANLEV
ncbi:hypothetical protein H0H92_000932, partial [Tricholoma furcatifolium]